MFLAKPAYAGEEMGAPQILAGNDQWFISSDMVTMWVIMVILALVCIIGTRHMRKHPSGLQNFLETVVELLHGMVVDIMGEKRAKRYGPFLMTFFLMILCSNYIGLLPLSGMHLPGYVAPTANLSVTAGLALIVIVGYFIIGFMDGRMAFIKHYFLTPMLPMNLLDTITRPLSLALRLYGNIFGEEMILGVLFGILPFFLPLPMYALSVMFGAIQAYVFTLLACIYWEEASNVEGH
ncbi:MAG: F0F1 ATP synthase subunit A [Clostridiales bacterium]|nr:F0F1 ATP synthase subunit A [Clostridiales bacterium]